MEDPNNLIQLQDITMPFLKKGKEQLSATGGKFVHYTSAENAMNIIKSKKLWMRSPKCMNDYSEITHGYNKLLNYFNTEETRASFIEAIDLYENGIALEILNDFDKWWKDINLDTFITSVSIHHSNENAHGRLSMWRGYGNNSASAAIVINNPPEPVQGLNIFL